MNATVVVLSRFPEIFAGFRESVDRDAPELPKLVVWDSSVKETDLLSANASWILTFTTLHFQIAHNANIGWRAAGNADLLYAGDDTRIIEPDTIKRLSDVAKISGAGIVAARILHQDHDYEVMSTVVDFVPFVFVYIKAEVIAQVGYLDEEMVGYGWDDLEYCYRARKAGFKIVYANGVHIQHGVGGVPWGSTFKRIKTEAQMAKEDEENMKRFARKYGIAENREAVWKAIRDL